MDLGKLEAEVLGAIKRHGRASTREVLKDITRRKKMAYTTISTTLVRLHKKGLLMREVRRVKGGSNYLYFFSENQQLQNGIIDRFLNTMVYAFGPTVISSINEKLDQLAVFENKS